MVEVPIESGLFPHETYQLAPEIKRLYAGVASAGRNRRRTLFPSGTIHGAHVVAAGVDQEHEVWTLPTDVLGFGCALEPPK
jgi:hypothetical protein